MRIAPRSLQSIEYSAPTAALGALVSYGQVMLHEFMHVRSFLHPSGDILDLKAHLPSCPNEGKECEGKSSSELSDLLRA